MTPTVEAPLAATEATVLAAAQALYATAPAHGMPSYDRTTGERTHCVLSAIYVAACNLDAPELTGPACRRLAKVAKVPTVVRLAEWEAAADTGKVREAFVRAGSDAV